MVFEVRKDELHSYHYDASSKVKESVPSICLLFHENHYDIVEYNSNISAEEFGLKRK